MSIDLSGTSRTHCRGRVPRCRPLAPPMGLEMGALGSISADVRHKAAPPGPRRSPPALGVPWGHAPPVWCHTGAHNTPDWTHDSAPGWRRSWRLGVCGSGPGAFQVDVDQPRARVRVPGSPWVVWGAWGSSRAAVWQCFRSCQLNPPTGCARGPKTLVWLRLASWSCSATLPPGHCRCAVGVRGVTFP